MSADLFNLGEYAAGWDDAAWNCKQLESLSLDQLRQAFANQASGFEALAAADELDHPESAAYKAGAAYAYRMAHNAVVELIAHIDPPADRVI